MRRNRDFIGPAGMGGTVALWGASSLVKNIQSGQLTNTGGTTATATITAVVTENTVVYATMHTQAGSASDARNQWYTLALTNSTTLTLTMNANAGYYGTFRYFVVEYMPGVVKPIQRVSYLIAGGVQSVGTAITEVNLAKAFVVYTGSTCDTASGVGNDPNSTWTSNYFSSATLLTSLRNTASSNAITPLLQVVEFF